jgi:cell division protein FtsQ
MSSIALLSNLYNREKTRSRSRARLIFTILIAVLATILVIEIVFHFVISPRLKLTRVEIVADKGLPLSNEAILKLAGLDGSDSFFAVDTARIAERLTAFAPVKSVSAERIFPTSLKIAISMRKPLGISLAGVDGRTVPVMLDEDGVVFQIGASVSEFDLPALSGFTFTDVELGQRVNNALHGFLGDLMRLRDSSRTMFDLISELEFQKKERAGFEVTLYPRDYRVPVRIGSRINTEIMRKILLVLDVFTRQGSIDTIEEIDFRTDTPLVRFEEE